MARVAVAVERRNNQVEDLTARLVGLRQRFERLQAQHEAGAQYCAKGIAEIEAVQRRVMDLTGYAYRRVE